MEDSANIIIDELHQYLLRLREIMKAMFVLHLEKIEKYVMGHDFLKMCMK